MKLSVEMDYNEALTNIGFAQAIINISHFDIEDLSEIIQYLAVYTDARRSERYNAPCDVRPRGGDSDA